MRFSQTKLSVVLAVAAAGAGGCSGGTFPLLSNFDGGGAASGGNGSLSGSGSSMTTTSGVGVGGSSGTPMSTGVGSGQAGGSSGSGSASSGGSSTSGSGASSGSSSASGGSASGTSGSSTGASGASSGSSSGGSGAGSGSSGEATGSSSGSSGTSSGSPGGDAGAGCPADVPAAGAPCPRVGFECEYGTSPELACNQLAQCAAGGWTLAPRDACPAGHCAAHYADITAGTSCDPVGLVCAYAEGTCNCAVPAGPIVRVDSLVRWECFPMEPGCRSPRPDIGTPCSDTGHICNYGACSGGVALECADGTWQVTSFACAAQ